MDDAIKQSPIRILVVDDQKNILDLFSAIFMTDEFILSTAASATKAVEKMQKKSFHVVITDIVMPDMDGLDLLRRIKEISPNTAVIVMTGHGTVEGAVEAIKLGAFDYLPKPIDLDKTVLKVKTAFRHYYNESKIEELSRLNTFSKKLNEFDNLQDVVSFLLESCVEELQSISGSIFLYDEKEKKLVAASACGPNSESLLNVTQKIDEGVAGYVARTKEPLLVEDITRDKRFKKRASSRYKNNSFLCIPLLNQDELIGIININNKKGNVTFSKTDLDTISVIANHSAATLSRMRLNEKLRHFNEELNIRIEEATGNLSVANQKLQDAIVYVENIIKELYIGIVGFNKTFTTFFLNTAAKQLVDSIPLEVFDSDVRKFPIRIPGVKWYTIPKDILELKKTFRYEQAELVKNEEEIIPISLRTSLLYDHKQNVIGGLLLIEDITEKTELENKLRLSERVVFIGELAAKVAHELNNPLDGVIRYINLTRQSVPDTGKTHYYLDQSLNGLNRMVSVVRGLLDFSRRSFQPQEKTTIENVVDEALSYLEHIRVPLHISVKKTIPNTLPYVQQGDLYHLFVNIIKNAYQSMEANGTLKISAKKDGDFIAVSTEDTGSGMTKETIENIFKPFFTTKEMGKGTGLGLTICYDIIKRYGGIIDVTSTINKGTTITVKLPCEGKKAT